MEHIWQTVSRSPKAGALPVERPSSPCAYATRSTIVLAVIPPTQDTPAGVSPATMRQTTGYDKPAVANDLRALLKRGAVVRVGEGHYVRA